MKSAKVITMKNYYKILGIDTNASEHEIKKAFRGLANIFHPDKESGSEEKFKEIEEAYYNLKDKKRRNAYDSRFHRKSYHQNQNIASHQYFASGFFNRFFDLIEEDFFDAFFYRPSSNFSQKKARSFSENHVHYDDLIK